MEKKKEKKNYLLNVFLFILLVILVGILVFWAARASLRNDRTEIQRNDFSKPDDSSEAEPEPAETVDIEKLTSNFVYIDIDGSSLGRGELALVNAERSYGGEPEDLYGIYESLFNGDGLQIASAKSAQAQGDREMLAALKEMLNDFYDESGLRTIIIEQAYAERKDDDTDEYLQGYYDEYGNYIVPQAPEPEIEDCYEHDSGYAVDFGLYIRDTNDFRNFDGSGDYAWFAENAYQYGFVLRYPEDKSDVTGVAYSPSHFRYVGKEAAAVMNENGFCFEEFLDFIKGYGFDSPLVVQTSEGCRVMYYIGDSGIETTKAQVPVDAEGNACPYTVSGNNIDGYIITVMPTAQYSAETDISSDNNQKE